MPVDVRQLSGHMVQAALAAAYEYDRECARRRRAHSQRVYGHPAAHIASEQPDPAERMRRALEAALNA